MRRKAIFFDIDGTLWDEQSRMPESACRAIREMKAAGHAVLICSGRSMGYIFDERLKALEFDGCVSSAGAMVEVGGKTLLCRLASAEDLMNGVNAAKAHRYAPLLEGNSYLYMDREDFIPTPYIDKLYRELDWRIRSLRGTWGEWPDVTKLSMIATAEPAPETQAPVTGEITSIKVLGAGCKSCHQMYENTVKAVQAAGLGVGVEYITDMEKVMQYGAMSMPVLVVNEKVVSAGKVLKEKELAKFF